MFGPERPRIFSQRPGDQPVRRAFWLSKIVAAETMNAYFAGMGHPWPAVEADEILQKVAVTREHRWTSDILAERAEATLARANFPMIDLVRDFLGISVRWTSLAHLDKSAHCHVYGRANPQTRSIEICERTRSHGPLARTTLAHELGHVLLHKRNRKRCLLYTNALPSSRKEREANAFMQAIVLPTSVLELAILYRCHQRHLDPRLAFNAANSASSLSDLNCRI